MKKLFRIINRFLFLDNSRLLSQIKVFELLKESNGLTKSEIKAMNWYFKKMLLKDIGKFGQIDEVIKILEKEEKESKEVSKKILKERIDILEKRKTSEEVKN